jgi:hypothetical protein
VDPDVKWLAAFLLTVLMTDAAVVLAVVATIVLGSLSVPAEAVAAIVALVVGGLGAPLLGLYLADRVVTEATDG